MFFFSASFQNSRLSGSNWELGTGNRELGNWATWELGTGNWATGQLCNLGTGNWELSNWATGQLELTWELGTGNWATGQLEKITWNRSGQPTGEQGTVQLSNWVCELETRVFAEIHMLRFENAARYIKSGGGAGAESPQYFICTSLPVVVGWFAIHNECFLISLETEIQHRKVPTGSDYSK